MSKHNRERKKLWRLKLTKKQLGQQLTGIELSNTIKEKNPKQFRVAGAEIQSADTLLQGDLS